MEIIFKYSWAVFMIVTIINGLVFKSRSKSLIAKDPDLKEGYDKILKGWLLFGNIPWLIIAIGDLSGITNGVIDYFFPKSLNPMVLIFHISIIAIWIMGSRWIYLQNGAEFLSKHPGLIRYQGLGRARDITSVRTIKIIWALAVAGGLLGMIMMWTFDIA